MTLLGIYIVAYALGLFRFWWKNWFCLQITHHLLANLLDPNINAICWAYMYALFMPYVLHFFLRRSEWSYSAGLISRLVWCERKRLLKRLISWSDIHFLYSWIVLRSILGVRRIRTPPVQSTRAVQPLFYFYVLVPCSCCTYVRATRSYLDRAACHHVKADEDYFFSFL